MRGIFHQAQNLLALMAGGLVLIFLSPVILLYVIFNLVSQGGASARNRISG